MPRFWNTIKQTYSGLTQKGDIQQVALIENNQGTFIDVRNFYHEGSELKPGKGILIAPEDVESITAAIAEAKKAIRT